jgi:ankyrin repeat protein
MSDLAASNDIETIHNLIEKGENLELLNEDGNTPLIRATIYRDIELVCLLINAGVNLDFQNKNGITALHIASKPYEGHLEIARVLIEAGANLDIQDSEDGETALSQTLSCYDNNNNIKIAYLLIEAGANIHHQDKYGYNPLGNAYLHSIIDIVYLLIEKGANANLKCDEDGDTILIVATRGGDTKIVRHLIEKGAKLDIQNEEGNTALLVAIQTRHTEIACMLIEAGAYADKTAMNLIIKHDDKDLAHLLLKNICINKEKACILLKMIIRDIEIMSRKEEDE